MFIFIGLQHLNNKPSQEDIDNGNWFLWKPVGILLIAGGFITAALFTILYILK